MVIYTQKSPCSYLAHLIVKILIKTDLPVCASLVAQLVPDRGCANDDGGVMSHKHNTTSEVHVDDDDEDLKMRS